MLERQRHRIMGDSVDEVGRSVQRIDDPAVFGLAGSITRKLIFLAEHGMVRKGVQNSNLHDFLGGIICFCDKVCWPFVLHAGPTNPIPDRRPAARTAFSQVSRYTWSSL